MIWVERGSELFNMKMEIKAVLVLVVIIKTINLYLM